MTLNHQPLYFSANGQILNWGCRRSRGILDVWRRHYSVNHWSLVRRHRDQTHISKRHLHTAGVKLLRYKQDWVECNIKARESEIIALKTPAWF